MAEVVIAGKTVSVSPKKLIGAGGEAEVYDIGRGLALKLFKPPDHPDYALSAEEQRGARERLAVHQTKLPALMALSLPSRVVTPVALAHDRGGAIAGYTMPLIRKADPLMRFSDRTFRGNGVSWDRVRSVLVDLHGRVAALHAAGVVIGDFNDLNVLVTGNDVHLIDTDSYQFGPFTTQLFTPRFLDPLLTDGKRLVLARPHNRDSDWYAYSSIALQTLLFADPFGGVYRPANPRDRVPHDERPLRRITLFHPEVRAPKQAVPIEALPDDLLHFFRETFERDRRGVFPLPLVESMRWTTCRCGFTHARASCPRCTAAAPGPVRPLQIVRGNVSVEEVFSTAGTIVTAALEDGQLLWLAHENGRFVRENGTVVFAGALDPSLTFHLQRDRTLVLGNGRCVTFDGDQLAATLECSAIGVNGLHTYWLAGDELLRDGRAGTEVVGAVLGASTRFWVGERFGFGIYGAGAMTVGFVFDASRRGINDSVALPPISGQLVDATCIFTDERAWFLTTTSERGRLVHRCTVIRRDGAVEASGELAHGIHGHAAAGDVLLAPADDGITRIELDRGGLRVSTIYSDTEPFVDSGTRLFAGARGLFAAGPRTILNLTR